MLMIGLIILGSLSTLLFLMLGKEHEKHQNIFFISVLIATLSWIGVVYLMAEDIENPQNLPMVETIPASTTSDP